LPPHPHRAWLKPREKQRRIIYVTDRDVVYNIDKLVATANAAHMSLNQMADKLKVPRTGLMRAVYRAGYLVENRHNPMFYRIVHYTSLPPGTEIIWPGDPNASAR